MAILVIVLSGCATAGILVWFAMNEGAAGAQAFIDYLEERHGHELDRSRHAVRARKWPTYGFWLKHERREHEVI